MKYPKPERKGYRLAQDMIVTDDLKADRYLVEGYNQAIDDYEKFLPSEEEIEKILFEYTFDIGGAGCGAGYGMNVDDAAKAIHKRIRGE